MESVIEHANDLSPARKKNILEHADVARESKQLATMRRDLDLDIDVTQIVLDPPDRSELREMFRRFEFRNLLNRIDLLQEAIPAAEKPRVRARRSRGAKASCRRGSPAASASRSTTAASRSRPATR